VGLIRIISTLLKTLIMNISKSAVSNSLNFLVDIIIRSWSNGDRIFVVGSQGVQKI